MGLGIAFETLGEIVDHYEAHNCAVRNVETTADQRGETLRATLDLAVSLDVGGDGDDRPGFTPEDATLSEDGVLDVSFPVSSLVRLPPTVGSAASVVGTDVDVVDGHPVVGLELAIDPAEAPQGMQSAGEGADSLARPAPTERTGESDREDELADVRDESVPAYEDTEYLRALYEGCDNFGEMSRRIEMDVSSETVRRYMIEADVHQPDSYRTAAVEESDETTGTDGGSETRSPSESHRDGRDRRQSPDGSDEGDSRITGEGIVTDGIGLPDDVLIEDVADAVVGSGTVHQVQQHLGLERTQARDLLEELNLLDLVLRPIAASDRTVSYDQVATRLRQCTGPQGDCPSA